MLIKSLGAASAGKLTWENTPATGSSTQSWTIQPRASTITSDGYDKLVVSSDVSSVSTEDTAYPQLVVASGTGATQSTTGPNGNLGDLDVTSVSFPRAGYTQGRQREVCFKSPIRLRVIETVWACLT